MIDFDLVVFIGFVLCGYFDMTVYQYMQVEEVCRGHVISYSEVVITLDFESSIPSSNLGRRTLCRVLAHDICCGNTQTRGDRDGDGETHLVWILLFPTCVHIYLSIHPPMYIHASYMCIYLTPPSQNGRLPKLMPSRVVAVAYFC